MRMVVVLPEPLAPSRPKISPLLTVRSSRSTATSSPNRLCSASMTIAGWLMRFPRVGKSHGDGETGSERGGRSVQFNLGCEEQVGTLLLSQGGAGCVFRSSAHGAELALNAGIRVARRPSRSTPYSRSVARRGALQADTP